MIAMGRRTPSAKAARDAGVPAVFRPQDLAHHGLSADVVVTWVRRGEVERIARGLYRFRDAPADRLDTVAAVAQVVPQAVVCLLTALHIHEIGTQTPREVWIGLPSKAGRPKVRDLPIRVVWFSPRMMTYGVDEREVHGVRVRITSPARTVVDCFRYRNKIGTDVAVEALRDVLQRRKTTVPEILRAAEQGRVRNVMAPYIEAVLS